MRKLRKTWGNRSRENGVLFKEGYCEGQWIACRRPCRAHCLRIVQRNSQQSGVDFFNALLSPVPHPASPYVLSQIKELTPFVHATTQLHTCCISASPPRLKKKHSHTFTSSMVIWCNIWNLVLKGLQNQHLFPFHSVPKLCFNSKHNIGHFSEQMLKFCKRPWNFQLSPQTVRGSRKKASQNQPSHPTSQTHSAIRQVSHT